MKKTAALCLTLLATLILVSCGDFLNSSRSPQAEPVAPGPGQRVKNPFPPGFDNPNGGDFSETMMLVNTGVNVIAKSARGFFLQSELLVDAVTNYVDALQTGANADATAVKEQWKKTMLAYHAVDSAPVGPLLDNGRYLIDHLYSWPLVNFCGIDREVVRLQTTGQVNPKLLYTAKGLGALEYLLFEPTLQPRCNASTYPETAVWAARSAAEKTLDRAKLAAALSRDLRERASDLDFAWDPQGGNFSKTLIDGSRFVPLKEATNALSDALFAIEKVKDTRLGRVIGIHDQCDSEEKKCPELAEHDLSGTALEAIAVRLKAFRALFFGNNNPDLKAYGIDDYLTKLGHGAVAAGIRANIDRAIAEAESLSAKGTLQAQVASLDPVACAATTITDRREPLCALHQDIRAVSNSLRIDVLSILALRSPPDFQGDND